MIAQAYVGLLLACLLRGRPTALAQTLPTLPGASLARLVAVLARSQCLACSLCVASPPGTRRSGPSNPPLAAALPARARAPVPTGGGARLEHSV